MGQSISKPVAGNRDARIPVGRVARVTRPIATAAARLIAEFMAAALVGLFLLGGLAAAPDAQGEVTDARVREAIDRLRSHLIGQQLADGSWPAYTGSVHDRGHTGPTAIATYALLASGMPYQHPAIERAIGWLSEHPSEFTYSRALRAHVWAALPARYEPLLLEDARWLINAQSGGLFDYGPVRRTRVDHSVTQYGVLGLWEFTKRGGSVPATLWQDATEHFLEWQRPDGGWNYGSFDRDADSYGSMTCAGLTVLYTALMELHRGSSQPPPRVIESIQRGLTWLDQRFAETGSAGDNPGKGSWAFYYLYGIERVALANGLYRLNGRDWYRAGAEYILQREAGRGGVGGVPESAFALLFLSRGRVPVWANKLRVPGEAWNRRPMDLHFFTAYLSEAREAEQNWLLADLDDPPADWLNTPVLYLSLTGTPDDAVFDRLADRLRTYLNLGGMVVINPEDADFSRAARRLCQVMFPGLSLEPAGDDHPVMTLVQQVRADRTRTPLVLDNGARTLAVVLPEDWGLSFQSRHQGRNSLPHEVMTNVYALATNRGRLPPRLHRRFPPTPTRTPERALTLARAVPGQARTVVEPGSDSLTPLHPAQLEPTAWWPLRRSLIADQGLDLRAGFTPLRDAGDHPAVLLHLAGVAPLELSDEEADAMRRYVDAGGTVLIETLGGRGRFAASLTDTLTLAFGAAPGPIGRGSPILTGRGLPNGRDASTVRFRDYAIQMLNVQRDPLLESIRVDGRDAVLISHQDLSLGAMGSMQWNIAGYAPESARDLLTNILLAAAMHRAGLGAADPNAQPSGLTDGGIDRLRDLGRHVEDRAPGEPALPDRLF